MSLLGAIYRIIEYLTLIILASQVQVAKFRPNKALALKNKVLSIIGNCDFNYSVTSKYGDTFMFDCVNEVTHFRAETFFTKEPETIDWIDSFEDNACLWDIGANIGLYSIYAAKTRRCKVYAFEPSVFNLENLARNINLNKLSEKIVILPIALTSISSESMFNLSSTEHGEALSSFGVCPGIVGHKATTVFSYKTIGLAGDDISKFFKIELPDYIKIDVDGIEEQILLGMQRILSLPTLKSVSVEVDEKNIIQQRTITDVFTSYGFRMISKKHSPMFETGDFSNQFNCVYSRKFSDAARF